MSLLKLHTNFVYDIVNGDVETNSKKVRHLETADKLFKLQYVHLTDGVLGFWGFGVLVLPN